MPAEAPELYANCARRVGPRAISDAELPALDAIAANPACWDSGWDAPVLYGFPNDAAAFTTLVDEARRSRR